MEFQPPLSTLVLTYPCGCIFSKVLNQGNTSPPRISCCKDHSADELSKLCNEIFSKAKDVKWNHTIKEE